MVTNLGYILCKSPRTFIEFHAFGKTHKLYGFQPPPTQLVTSHRMENLHWQDTPMYIPQFEETEILTSEGDLDKQPETQELI